MSNDCPDCTQARLIWHWGAYHDGCKGCQTRALSKCLGFWQSQRNGRLSTEYRAALQTIFGEDWTPGHEAVKAEAARIEQLKKGASQ
ncbi:hypothetical protein [Curvibacter lanceolatus]|uniref:hypothetical protein n=1 Tax=Curvibacter lanceolatus TaxID=86182 RepID=UPI00036AADC3|nr:hypothetical protein [Curvibacter lanceolatus]